MLTWSHQWSKALSEARPGKQPSSTSCHHVQIRYDRTKNRKEWTHCKEYYLHLSIQCLRRGENTRNCLGSVGKKKWNHFIEKRWLFNNSCSLWKYEGERGHKNDHVTQRKKTKPNKKTNKQTWFGRTADCLAQLVKLQTSEGDARIRFHAVVSLRVLK